jgi:NAD(P) transhydrogenase subunit beta
MEITVSRDMKRSMRTGFAGVESEQLVESHTTVVFGYAEDALPKLRNAVRALW